MDKMNEALEELKRVDHLIYVSLKYTRTVDVIQNILNRMVDGYSLMIDALTEFAGERGVVSAEPESAIERAELIRRVYGGDNLISDNMGLYLLLRKLLRARHVTRENEYRRHVTMKTVVEGREEIVNIDIITNYYLFQREFLVHVKSIVDERVEVELKKQSLSDMPAPSWMSEEPEEEPVRIEEKKETVVHRTPAKKNTVKVRPVGSPPRKRAPRPKKYKIQIPKIKNSITLPYEYDPHFRKEMEKEKARLKAEEDRKDAAKKKRMKKKVVRKSPKKKVVRKSPKKKTTRKIQKKTVKKRVKKKTHKKPVKRQVKKKIVKKAAKKPAKKTTKRLVKKKVVKKIARKAPKKKVVRKKTVKKAVKKPVKKTPKRTVKRFFKRVVKRVTKGKK